MKRSGFKTHFPDAKQIEIFRENIGNRVLKVDDFNTAQIKSMLEGRGWFRDDEDGTNAARYGWLIAQHADRDPEFQERALTLIEANVMARKAAARGLKHGSHYRWKTLKTLTRAALRSGWEQWQSIKRGLKIYAERISVKLNVKPP